MKPNVTTVTEAARLKGCTRQAIYDAINRGDLNTARVGDLHLILKDEAWKAYQVKETGGRRHRSYQKANAQKQESS